MIITDREIVNLTPHAVVGEHGSREIADRAISRIYAVRHHGPFAINPGPAPVLARWA